MQPGNSRSAFAYVIKTIIDYYKFPQGAQNFTLTRA